MGWKEDQEVRKREIAGELKQLFAENAGTDGVERLNNRFLKNFGCINFKSEEFYRELELARSFHAWHMKMFPTCHEVHASEPYRSYHQITCKCGFAEECDSSD